MKNSILIFLIIFFTTSSSFARDVPPADIAVVKQKLEKLNVLGSVLYVGAHPDDENNYVLSYLANEKKYRTGYLALNRGEGGQNLLGDEQGDYLGLIRTEELLDARKTEGDEQFFTRSRDFGFSKTVKETMDFWGHDRILADVVWIVRKFRPDVIICRFPEDRRAGHGNHWASAIFAHEAFNAAADPAKFPEQLKYVKPWQAKRLVWNTGDFFATQGAPPTDQIKIDIGLYNAVLGEGYGEMEAKSRSSHQSQGQGSALQYGQHFANFENIEGPKADSSLMDGINTTWSRVKGGVKVQLLIDQIMQEFDMNNPDHIVPLLLKARAAVQELTDDYWKEQKTKEIDKLIMECSGIVLQAYSDAPYVVAGQPLQVHLHAINRSNASVELNRIDLFGNQEDVNLELKDNIFDQRTFETVIPKNTPISQPYWLRKPRVGEYYFIDNQTLVGLPLSPPSLPATFSLTINGVPITVTMPVIHRYIDQAIGEIHDPMVVAPDVTVNITKENYVFTNGKQQSVAVKVRGFSSNITGTVHLKANDHFNVLNNDQKIALTNAGDEKILYFNLAPRTFNNHSATEDISASVNVDGKLFDRSLVVIFYPHIPTITVFPPAEAKVTLVNLKTTAKEVGYIMGAGDKIPESLEQIGLHVTVLGDAALNYNEFKKFDAIVVGVRAYNTRKQLGQAQDDLLRYVKDGGVMVVQYNVSSGYGTNEFVTNHRSVSIQSFKG